MFHARIRYESVLACCFLFTYVQAPGYSGQTTQDLPNTKANTLSDDADDIQKQLDNEAKDRMKFIRPQTIWVLHYPTNREKISTSTESMGKSGETEMQMKRTTCSCHFGCNENNISYVGIVTKLLSNTKGWNYKDQSQWQFTYPSCGGRSQSPVNIPCQGLLRTKAPRPMLFSMYDAVPKSMRLVRQGATVVLFGNWGCNRPVIYGGAAHSRRYVFHSLAVRQPSEHTVGGLYYPMETQALHVSVEYSTLEHALSASPKDKLAMLVISNIYRHSNYSHRGLKELVNASLWTSFIGMPMRPMPLSVFCPPLKEYAAYHGSLTTPPCTESVLWMVRAKPLPITRELVDLMEKKSFGEPGKSRIRLVQPLNDRKMYFFD